MSLHIYAGAAILPFIAWHAWAYTARFRVGYSAERREVLRFGSDRSLPAPPHGSSGENVIRAIPTRWRRSAFHRLPRTPIVRRQPLPYHVLDQRQAS